jgi:hypothetical protein
MTLAESRPTLGRIARRNFVFQDMVREAANCLDMGFRVGRRDVAESFVSNLDGKLGKEGNSINPSFLVVVAVTIAGNSTITCSTMKRGGRDRGEVLRSPAGK